VAHRLLLVPVLTELEWTIKPQLEQWAEVASFDAPGVGSEPPAETFGPDAIVRRALAAVDERAWERFVVVVDSWGAIAASRLASVRPDAVQGFAFGHARLSNRMDGERPPINRELVEAMGALLRQDHEAFVRYGLTQYTHGSVGDELAARMLERIPLDLLRTGWELVVQSDEPIGERLKALDCPLLFAKHEGCLGSNEEGFEDVAAAFPEAHTVAMPEAPCVSPDFAEALRSFCAELPGHSP
jgi:pimeloyl-ACP methyl ester carboxylesterase